MCPPGEAKKVRKAPATRRRENLANWRVMRWLDDERQQRGLSDRQVGKLIGYHNGTRVRQYLNQRIVAGPEMVGRLAVAVEVSPIEALWRAEHYSAVFDYLDKFYRLGWSWMRADKVSFDETRGSDFVPHHIGRSNSLPDNVDLEAVPDELVPRYHQVAIYNESGIYKIVSMVKPIAWAILLGVGLFPRRGDKVRPETAPLIEQLSIKASKVLPAAERAVVPPELSRALRRPFKESEKILPRRYYGRMRLAVVAEYVHHWCDVANAAYADYARLVLYEQGAFVRAPTGDEDIWEWQRADFPTIDQLVLETPMHSN